jgi:putative ABC transport system permease protein
MFAGSLATVAVIRIMKSMLFEVKPFDPAVFVLVACGILLVSLTATIFPALRTTAIDPAQTLRAE